MNLINLFTRLYAFQRNYKYIPFWVFTPFRKLTRFCANKVLPFHLKKTLPQCTINIQKDVIVSFTSYPARILTVWMVVRSLKNQNILPEKIILWLSKKQFPKECDIPKSLWDQVDDFFEIRMVDDDIRSHKKYYYALKEFPFKTIVTCDDDVCYHPDMLQSLIKGSLLYPNSIISNVTKKITYDNQGNMLPYHRWENEISVYEMKDLLQIGMGGVLYPPNSLDTMVLNKSLFMNLCPTADDIWLNCMARRKGTKIIQSAMKILPLPIGGSSESLTSVNVGEFQNDRQLNLLRHYFIDNGMNDIYSKNKGDI